jgi:hypothetical protein
MVTGRRQAVQLAVEHVGEPDDGVPMPGHHVRERPGDALAGETDDDMGILGDVEAVIDVHERSTHDREEDGERQQRQRRGDERRAGARRVART